MPHLTAKLNSTELFTYLLHIYVHTFPRTSPFNLLAVTCNYIF